MLFQQNPLYPITRMQPLKQEQGVVIVMALFIVALIATMSYFMLTRVERDTKRASLLFKDAKAQAFAQGGVAWAMDQLRNNWVNQKPNKLIDHLPQTATIDLIHGNKVTSTIYDMQARFNLNNLSDPDAQADFIRLLRTLDKKMTEQNAAEIVRATVDWINPIPQENEYTRYYLNLSYPYRPAHRLMQNSSEWLLVKGVTENLYHLLQPYITALPEPTLINVQTADLPVLMTISPNVDAQTAKTLISLRKETPFVSIQTFANLDVVKNKQIPPTQIVVSSDYFLVETKVSIEKQEIVLYTLLMRKATEGLPTIHIIWQSKGMW